MVCLSTNFTWSILEYLVSFVHQNFQIFIFISLRVFWYEIMNLFEYAILMDVRSLKESYDYVIPVNSVGSETHKKKANLLKLFDKMAGFLVLNPYYPSIRKLSQRRCNLSLVLSISLFTSQSSLLFLLILPKIAIFTKPA